MSLRLASETDLIEFRQLRILAVYIQMKVTFKQARQASEIIYFCCSQLVASKIGSPKITEI